MSFEHEWKKFKKNPLKYTTDKIQEGLGELNQLGEKIGLVRDPTSKNDTYTPIARIDGSEYLQPTAMRNEDYYNQTLENIPTGYTGNPGYNQIVESGKGTPNEINTAKIDNFIPNTAKGGNNMANNEDKTWLERNTGIDPTKLATTAITAGINYYNQQQQNEFNAKQAELNRKFEENMSNTAFQRQAQDMALAGVNPIASADMGGASTPSGSTATGTTPYYADPLTIANTALTQAQVNNIEADTELKGKQSGKTEEEIKGMRIENQYKDELKRLEILTQQIGNQKVKAETDKIFQEVRKMETELRKMDEEINVLKAEGKIKEAEAKTRTRNRRAYAILEMAESATRSIGNIAGSVKGTSMLPNTSNVTMTN